MIDPYLLGFVCRRHNKYVVISTSELSTNWKRVLCDRTGDAIREKRCLFMSLASLFIFFFFWLEVFFSCRSFGVFPTINRRYFVRFKPQISQIKEKEISIVHNNERLLYLYFKVCNNYSVG